MMQDLQEPETQMVKMGAVFFVVLQSAPVWGLWGLFSLLLKL